MQLDSQRNNFIDLQNSDQIEDLSPTSVSMPAISEIMKKLSLISIQETCGICQKLFRNSSNPVACIQCSTAFHNHCLSRRPNSEYFKCQICENASKCLKCSNPLTDSQNCIKCSLCLSATHSECYPFPLELFEISRPYFMKIYGTVFSRKKFICYGCRKHGNGFKISEIVTIDGRKYYFMKMRHSSPIHYTWKSQQQVDFEHQSMDEEYSVAQMFEPNIENIVSVNVPKQMEHLSVHELLNAIKERKNVQDRCKQIKFLIKWEQSFKPIWQNEGIVFLHFQMLQTFFLKMQVNYILSFRETVPEYMLASQMGKLFDRQPCLKKLLFLGSPALEEYKENNKDNKTILIMHKLISHYQQKVGQSLKSKREDDATIVTVLGFLINTIYFSFKNVHPVVVFTTGGKISWWKNHFERICPYHIIMVCRQYPFYSISRKQALMGVNNKTGVYDFDILLIQVVKLIEFDKLILKKIIDNSALLILDDQPNLVTKSLYLEAKIAKIKLGHKDHEDTGSTYSFKVNNNSNMNSLSDAREKSGSKVNLFDCQTEKSCQAKNLTNVEQLSKDLTTIKSTLNKLKINLINLSNSQEFQKVSMLDELQRTVYLRYIMAFGLNFSSLDELIEGLKYLEGSFFGQRENKDVESILYQYTKQFMSVVYSFSQDYMPSNPLKLHYLFGLDVFIVVAQAKDVLRRIVLLFAMKRFYKHETEIKKIQISKGFETNEEGKEKYPQYLDVMLCQAILERGYGRWESVSEYPRVWEYGGSPLAMRQYICKKAGLSGITMAMFTNFVKIRVGHITAILQDAVEQE